jgi:Triosephosphate isomerase
MKVAKAIIVIVFYAPFIQALLTCRPQVSNNRVQSLVQLWALNTRKPFITGNWKMNPTTKQEAVELASGIAAAVTPESPGDVAIFVPYPFIEAVQSAVGDKLLVGAEVCTNTN